MDNFDSLFGFGMSEEDKGKLADSFRFGQSLPEFARLCDVDLSEHNSYTFTPEETLAILAYENFEPIDSDHLIDRIDRLICQLRTGDEVEARELEDFIVLAEFDVEESDILYMDHDSIVIGI